MLCPLIWAEEPSGISTLECSTPVYSLRVNAHSTNVAEERLAAKHPSHMTPDVKVTQRSSSHDRCFSGSSNKRIQLRNRFYAWRRRGLREGIGETVLHQEAMAGQGTPRTHRPSQKYTPPNHHALLAESQQLTRSQALLLRLLLRP